MTKSINHKNITRKEVLQSIAKSTIYDNLGLFVGAGMSMAILNDDKKIALSWKELINKCCDDFKIDIENEIITEGFSYPEIASKVIELIAEKENIRYQDATTKLKSKIADLTSWYPEDKQRGEYKSILLSINPKWIVTTNYDLILECVLAGKCHSIGPDESLIAPSNLIPIYHLHGIRTDPDSIVISQEDYISLFRPNQYRQHKLALTFKESTTLLIGYGLSDVNVLTAFDWTKNVYSDQITQHPHEIIQLLRKTNPKCEPYKDRNGVIIIEFSDLLTILTEIADYINKQKEEEKNITKKLKEFNNILKNPKAADIDKFIDDESFRNKIVKNTAMEQTILISGFLEIFTKAMENGWNRASKSYAFHAYEELLRILLDILENIQFSKLPPVLFHSIAYNLDLLAYYIGKSIGKSHAAYDLWNNRKNNIATETLLELKNIASTRDYTGLSELIKSIDSK